MPRWWPSVILIRCRTTMFILTCNDLPGSRRDDWSARERCR
ncbi:hypothetical protein O972_00445 [Mycobacterium avium subsp. avium 10-9275]|nr:hypothetical protein O972_00445 [Mycobacterium avium subsp. avium 10-9275]ETB33130.1 hypothetical protein O971_00445 [Mycobacterium avium subsp. hominissuis 10-4249]ETB41728.1 hypothetical protein O974_21680 [Mycobacterium avium 11-0986]